MEAMRHVPHMESLDEFVVTIVTRVAETRGVDPTEIDERLYDAVDAEAVWRLFRDRPESAGSVEFEFADATVRVSATDEITVET